MYEQNMCVAPDASYELQRSISEAYEALPKDQYASCNPRGSILNPVQVSIRVHEKKAMLYRYFVLKAAEMATEALLLHGNKVQLDIPGTNLSVNPIDFSAVERTQMAGVLLAVGGQVNPGEWFYLTGDHNTLYLLDRSEFEPLFSLTTFDYYISKVHSKVTGETRDVDKKYSDMLREAAEQQKQWERAYAEGRAI